MGSCCERNTAVNDTKKADSEKGKVKLDNGEEVDVEFYNQEDNLKKIQKIQAKYKESQSKKGADPKKDNK